MCSLVVRSDSDSRDFEIFFWLTQQLNAAISDQSTVISLVV